jgi:hypothetical protein
MGTNDNCGDTSNFFPWLTVTGKACSSASKDDIYADSKAKKDAMLIFFHGRMIGVPQVCASHSFARMRLTRYELGYFGVAP